MTTPLPKIGSNIEIGDGFVEINNLVSQNELLVSLMKEAEYGDRVELLHTILKFGSETYRIFGTTASAESIEKVALKIATEIDGKGENLVKGVQDIAAQMVAKTGDLSVRSTLEAWRLEFSELLNSNFNIENKASILSRFDDLIEAKSKSQNTEIANRLDFNVPDSAINLLQSNIRELVILQFGELGKKVEEINKALAVSEQAKLDKKAQASRGNDFEEALFEVISSFAHVKSDIADDPGKQKKTGLSGDDEGDITVDISHRETHGEAINFVWEGKLRSSTLSAKRCIEELEKGMANRGSRVGIIAVEKFAGLDVATGDVFKELKENMAVLVLDPLDIDVNAVRMAYLWARWKCLVSVGSSFDTKIVEETMSSIKLALKSFATIRTKNTQVKNLIDDNGELITLIESQIASELTKLSAAIDEVNAESQNQVD